MKRRFDGERHLRELGYKAPPAMVLAATTARLAGDWRAACAAANVDAPIDLADVTRRWGRPTAERIEADLIGFAPDYLRLQLLYGEGMRLEPHRRVVLSRSLEPFLPGIAVLVVTFPADVGAARRLVLRVADVDDLPAGWHDLPAWAWHADSVAERRWAYGASETRLPWHDTGGRPYAQGGLPTPGPDRAGEFEQLMAPVPEAEIAALWTEAGFPIEESLHGGYLQAILHRRQQALPVLASEVRRLTRRYSEWEPEAADRLVFRAPGYQGLTVTGRTVATGHRLRTPWRGPAAFVIEAPVDTALLRWGTMTPDQLHPLTHEALFPGRAQDWRPALHDPYAKVRVRCGSEWHTVEVAGASLRTPHHDDAELSREFLLPGIGGKPSGCGAAVTGFRTGRKPVPKDVRKARQALFDRAFHGDTDALLADLRAGVDPLVRAPSGGTLMHLLAHVDYERVLPVLLAAGFSTTDQDNDGETPLHAAARSADAGLMLALIAAGAARLYHPIVAAGRGELISGRFLKDYRSVPW